MKIEPFSYENNLRNNFCISKNQTVITFCGKLIAKKNFSTIKKKLFQDHGVTITNFLKIIQILMKRLLTTKTILVRKIIDIYNSK